MTGTRTTPPREPRIAATKCPIPLLEFPIFALGTRPDLEPVDYRRGDLWLQVRPPAAGRATMRDKELIVYAVSKLLRDRRNGQTCGPGVSLPMPQLLAFTGRATGGREYAEVLAALDRLAGTRLRTNIVSGRVEVSEEFGLIDGSTVARTRGATGRLVSVELQLSDWVMGAVDRLDVLTLHPEYMAIRKPVHRRIYELARKFGGTGKWRVGLDKLRAQAGSNAALWRLRGHVRALADLPLPDYRVAIDGTDLVHVAPARMGRKSGAGIRMPHLSNAALQTALKFAPGADKYALSIEWWDAMSHRGSPRNPDAAFIAWVKGRSALG